MKKRILAFLVLLGVLTSSIGFSVFAAEDTDVPMAVLGEDLSLSGIELSATHPTFYDVNDTDWFYTYVNNAYYYGLFDGTDSHTFTPYGNMTRAMYCVVIYRIWTKWGSDTVNNIGDNYFSDVNSADYYYNAVTWCYNYGVVDGVGDGKFAPNQAISRQEAATILMRITDHTGQDIGSYTFSDSSQISDWAVEHVNAICSYGLMEGDTEGGTFRPLDNMTRAECAKVLSIYYEQFGIIS